MATPSETQVQYVEDHEARRLYDQKPPQVPWDQHIWPPDDALVGDLYWAAQLRRTLSELHRLVVQLAIPHLKIGRVMYVQAGVLRTALEARQSPAPIEPTPRRSPRAKP
jgi:hypothetical protein